MSNVTIVPQKNVFLLNPTNLEEAMKFAQILANSSLAPKNYKGKPEDTFIAMQMGAELGLKPLQSVQNIEVINGKPAVYGDALIGLVQSHPSFEDIKEYFDEKLQGSVCKVKRKNQSEHTVVFSIDDAKKAALWNKPGPWQQYPKRMLQMRARGFALRDKFADALKGLITVEEAQDYPVDITPKSEVLNEKLNSLLSENVNIETQEAIEVDEFASREKLYQLIEEQEISDEKVDAWCKKADVSNLEELENDKINLLVQMLEKNATNQEIS